MLKTPFTGEETSPDTYIYKYYSVVVIVGGVDMLKTPVRPVNICLCKKNKHVYNGCFGCLKIKKIVEKKISEKITKIVINRNSHKRHIL